MKQLYGKLWVKCTAIALLIVFAVLLLASALGVAYLISCGAYLDGGAQLRQDTADVIMYKISYSDAQQALLAYRTGQAQELALIQERYTADKSNVYFEWVDEETGESLLRIGQADAVPFSRSHYSAHRIYSSMSFDGDDTTYELHIYLRDPLSAHDRAYHTLQWANRLIAGRVWLIVLSVFLLGVCLFLFIFLLCSMGHKEGVDGIYQCWFNKIPLDLLLAGMVFCGGLWVWFCNYVFNTDFWLYILLIAGLAPLPLALTLSVAGRAKAPGFFKNTLIYKVFAWIFRGLGRIPMVWRTALVWGALCLAELFFMFMLGWNEEQYAVLWLLSRGVLTIAILYLASSLRLLQKEGQAIADGQTDYKGRPIPRWLPALKKHEENLQSIQSGIQKAVDEQTRAERMKTELITNVSHDIKTPLTSIVNYVDLLEKEDIQPEKAKEYVDVLNRQAARLKKLTEDLVEASKASSGSLPVHLAPTDVNVLLSQLAGDYLEKLEAAQLEPIFRPAPSQPVIQADGQLLSRVLGNLFSNICKYAMPGTRVYFESAADEKTVSITFKNISKYELNIPAEELMARFVRGDRSRHTEGSGLGLSIAQSLTELQGGAFRIEIDGDLFKAVVTFPQSGEGV